MGKYGLLFVLALCILLATSASAFTVEVEPPTKNIHLNETAVFTLTVGHETHEERIFEIYSPDVVWDIATEPSIDRNLRIPAGKSKSTTLLVRPLYVNPGLYSLNLHVRLAGTSEVVKKQLQVGIIDDDRVDTYRPSINAQVDIAGKVDPRNDIPVKIRLRNQNRLDIQKLDIKLRSDLINKDYSTTLAPLEIKDLTFTTGLDPLTPPREDKLRVTLFAYADDKPVQFDLQPVEYRISPYGDIKQGMKVSKGFLTATETYRFENLGNTLRDTEFNKEFSTLEYFFVQTKPAPEVTKTTTGRLLSWHVLVEATEVQEIVITRNYRIIFYLILLAIGIMIAYFFVRSPIVVKKAAMVVGSQEGGISELKVIVNVKNRSSHAVRDLRIADKVPPIADIRKDFEVGTLKPEKVVRHESGALLKWEIVQLDPREERILSYKIHTKLQVLGGLTLPPAQIKYQFYGYVRTVYSTMENLFRR